MNCISVLHHLMVQLPDTTSTIINELFDHIESKYNIYIYIYIYIYIKFSK